LMLFSLVIAALPVGVIGNNFSQVWEEVNEEKKNGRLVRQREQKEIKVSMQRFAPFEVMSSLMVIDVWNERFPGGLAVAWDAAGEGANQMPMRGDFMGQIRVDLELKTAEELAKLGLKEVSREVTRQLRPDYDLVKRSVSGTIIIRWTWVPEATGHDIELKGKLTVTLIQATGLVNLNCSKPHDSYSNPFCEVLVYPYSAEMFGGMVQPCIWRSPFCVNTLNPRWNSSHIFDYMWMAQPPGTDLSRNSRSNLSLSACGDSKPLIVKPSNSSDLAAAGTAAGPQAGALRVLEGPANDPAVLNADA